MTFIIGCCFGSFGYLLATRLPKNSSLFPPSHCEACNTRLSWLELIPLLSFLLQKGRCRHCQTKIPFDYLIAEITCGLLFTLCLNYSPANPIITCFWLYSAWLLSISDYYFKILETSIFLVTSLVLWFGQSYLKMPFHWQTFLYCLLFAALFSYYYREKLGIGDLLLLLAWSPWLSFWQFSMLLFLSSSFGLLYFIVAKLLQKNSNRLPFIPFLSCGLFLVLHFNKTIHALFILAWEFP